MSKSLLLQLARDSIAEVFEAQNTIKREELLSEYPILNEPLACFVRIYIDNKLRGSFGTTKPSKSLLEEIVFNAKAAAFLDENFKPLIVSEYLNAEIELSLLTPLEQINNLHVESDHGLAIFLQEKEIVFLPQDEISLSSFTQSDLSRATIFTFQVEKQRDESIIT